MSLRPHLDKLYDTSAWLAAMLMVLTLVMVLLGMVDRYVPLNFRGTDMYAGYCMAGAGFLALAHTLKKGEHIRVTLLVNRLMGKPKRVLELWCLSAAVFLAGLFAAFSIKFAYQSWTLHDISTGNDATPLWIPQIGMALGAVVFLIAFVDELVMEILGKRVAVSGDEMLHNE